MSGGCRNAFLNILLRLSRLSLFFLSRAECFPCPKAPRAFFKTNKLCLLIGRSLCNSWLILPAFFARSKFILADYPSCCSLPTFTFRFPSMITFTLAIGIIYWEMISFYGSLRSHERFHPSFDKSGVGNGLVAEESWQVVLTNVVPEALIQWPGIQIWWVWLNEYDYRWQVFYLTRN